MQNLRFASLFYTERMTMSSIKMLCLEIAIICSIMNYITCLDVHMKRFQSGSQDLERPCYCQYKRSPSQSLSECGALCSIGSENK